MSVILDVCCSTRAWWPLGAGRHVGIDRRHDVGPDVCADFAALPFRDGVFDAVWADPPHFVRSDLAHFKEDQRRFGAWRDKRQAIEAIKELRSEALRVLRSGSGVFVLKWTVAGVDRRRLLTEEELLAAVPTMCVQDRRRARKPWSTCTVLTLVEVA